MKYLSEREARKQVEKDIADTGLYFSEEAKQQIIDSKMWRVNSTATYTENEDVNAGFRLDNQISDEKTLIECAYHWGESIEEARKIFAEMY